jgi:hypothetical protein
MRSSDGLLKRDQSCAQNSEKLHLLAAIHSSKGRADFLSSGESSGWAARSK